MSSSLRELLNQFVRQNHLEGQLAAARLPSYWAKVLGENLAKRTEIKGFDGGVMRVHVPDATWRAELNFRKEELRLSINRLAGGELVRTLIIR